jgi:hypothetical protein
MEVADAGTTDGAVNNISELLARAYLRYARVKVARSAEEALRSTECLDTAGELSPHGLTLTGQRGPRKESAQE